MIEFIQDYAHNIDKVILWVYFLATYDSYGLLLHSIIFNTKFIVYLSVAGLYILCYLSIELIKSLHIIHYFWDKFTQIR